MPTNGKTKASWLKFLKTVNAKWMWEPASIMYVCQSHFEGRHVRIGPSGSTRVHELGFPTLYNGSCIPEMQV